MSELWRKLGHLFYDESGEDNGTLPDIFVKHLTSAEVCKIYSWVRTISTMYTGKGQPTLWHRELQCDMFIADIDNPAGLVVEGIAESFHHGNIKMSIHGSAIPDLSVWVNPGEIHFDYQMGPEWGAIQLQTLFEFLWAIQQISPACEISQAAEGQDWPSHLFSDVWQDFVAVRKAK